MNYWVKSIKKFAEFSIILEHLLIAISAITGCVSISVFASLVVLSTEIASSTMGLGICVITVAIKKI